MTFNVRNNPSGLLVQLFEQLLAFWLEQKAMLRAAILRKEGPYADVDQHGHLSAQLVAFVSEQKTNQRRYLTDYQYEVYLRVVYACVALIDEQLLQQLEWVTDNPEKNSEAQRKWLDYLLEQHFFGSRSAGEVLIKEMEELADGDIANPELASIYLRVLWLGFDGKYHDNREQLDALKNKLLAINREKASSYFVGGRVDHGLYAEPDPELKEKELEEAGRIAPLSRWNRHFLYSLLAWFTASCIAWLVVTWEFHSLLNGAANL